MGFLAPWFLAGALALGVPVFVHLLRRQTTNVVVNFDPDAAGANAAEKSIALLTEEGFTIKLVTLDGGLDPDRYIRERGVEAYAAAIRGARRQSDYLIERARQLFPGNTAEAKIKKMNYLLPHIRRIPQKLERDQFIHDAAQKLDIDSAIMREEFRNAALKRVERLESHADIGLLPFEKQFLEIACNDAKSPNEYEDLHRDLLEFDRKMLKESRPNWQEQVLPNLPRGLFEALVSRRQGQDIENIGISEEQIILLRKVFLEAGQRVRSHREDMETVRDVEIYALRSELTSKRLEYSAMTDITSPDYIRVSHELLQLEKRLRELECSD